MSLFCTSIPVDLGTLKQSLPTKAFLHSLAWDQDRKVIVAVWEDDELESGRTVAIDFPLEDLRTRVLPVGVRKSRAAQRPAARPMPPAPMLVSSWKHPGSKLTPERVPPAPGGVGTKSGSGVEPAKGKRVKAKERSAPGSAAT